MPGKEGVRQLLLVVRGDDDDGTHDRADRLVRLLDVEFHAVEFLQQVVREFDVRLVDLVERQDRPHRRGEGIQQISGAQIVAHVVHPFLAQLAVAQAADGVVFVQTVVGLGRGLDVPGDQRRAQRGGDLIGQNRLAGARLALDQQRPLQRHGGVDGDLQIVGGDVAGGPLEPRALTLHPHPSSAVRHSPSPGRVGFTTIRRRA